MTLVLNKPPRAGWAFSQEVLSMGLVYSEQGSSSTISSATIQKTNHVPVDPKLSASLLHGMCIAPVAQHISSSLTHWWVQKWARDLMQATKSQSWHLCWQGRGRDHLLPLQVAWWDEFLEQQGCWACSFKYKVHDPDIWGPGFSYGWNAWTFQEYKSARSFLFFLFLKAVGFLSFPIKYPHLPREIGQVS